ncbi:MAG: peptidoglycan editing factor PgeF [Chloroflexota bacterium]|nr:MAG: peptidoglycan editing factor PgeF [Chloroflexota bacterium]
MIQKQAGGILYYQFESLICQGLFHGIFSRKGGVSPPPWESLNLGGTVGDDLANVRENLARLLDVSGFTSQQLVQVRQIHSANVITADLPEDALREGDAIATDQPGLILLMRFADCVPILFLDPENKAIAIAHAGWKGTLKGVVSEVVRNLQTNFGTSPSQLRVGIGPSIGPDRYQVGRDVVNETKRVFPDEYHRVLREDSDGVKLDLWKANEIHLRKSGVAQIEIASICTGSDPALWYSHRIEKGRTGRFAAVIGWK